MPVHKTIAALGAVLMMATPAQGNVVRIEIITTEPVGATHERISGRVHGELDPADAHNAIITDIELAPRNARGKVEYVAKFTLVKPVDMSASSGVLLYTVVNRGGGNAAASTDGHVTLVSGWQGDLVPTAENHTIKVPVARNRDGSALRGPLVLRFVEVSGHTTPLLIPRAQPSPYPPASLDTTRATLISAIAESPTGQKSGVVTIPANEWAFADCTAAPFPGTPDPSRICLRSGFDPARIYELRFTATDPLVLGIGLAATRDIGSFFRYETRDAVGTPNPVAGRISATVAEGSSQSGAFLRLSLLLGFNQDERGRIVWDGMNSHIASRLIDLNRRFAFPGGHIRPYELGHEGPVWWTPWADTARGRPAAGLLDRCRRTNTCPKILETFGAAEIWGLRESFTLVGTDAKADIPRPDNVRRYYFPSVSHGGGPGGFTTTPPPILAGATCELPSNPAPVAPMRSALMKGLIGWVTKGSAMPPERFPSIADGTLVANTRAAMGFPHIPSTPSPEGLQYPLIDYDAGPQFRYGDQSGVATIVPVVKRTLPQLVVRVNADGNETAGVLSPLLMAPLGTYTGWNVAASGVFKGQICVTGAPVGGFIPFARTRADRVARQDPRLSLEERYRDHEGYVRAVTDAAGKLVSDGYLLPQDAADMIGQARASDILK